MESIQPIHRISRNNTPLCVYLASFSNWGIGRGGIEWIQLDRHAEAFWIYKEIYIYEAPPQSWEKERERSRRIIETSLPRHLKVTRRCRERKCHEIRLARPPRKFAFFRCLHPEPPCSRSPRHVLLYSPIASFFRLDFWIPGLSCQVLISAKSS